MTGKNRIMIYGPKDDGTYVVEFRTAATSCGKPAGRAAPKPWHRDTMKRREFLLRLDVLRATQETPASDA
jgi:hypothetical protein